MLNSISHLGGSTLIADDGEIGHVRQAFFDDRTWTIRYLVVDAGTWLTGREVLISPYAVRQPLGSESSVHVALTRQQVKESPDVDTHQPVSRQHERQLMRHYAYPDYWDGGGLWAMGAMPYPPPLAPERAELQADKALEERELKAGEVHLRSTNAVAGYEIQARDDSIGHVQDFIFDDETWAIRYLVVDTSNWWPLGRKVLIGVNWADGIDWATRKVFVRLTREQVEASPVFEDVGSIHREYEMRLHQNYQRPGYWQ
jgi:hypothetical protein